MFDMLDPALLGRLTFAHHPPSLPPLPAGHHNLGIAEERDTLLVVPEGLDTTRPVKLMVLFHGGGGYAQKILPIMEKHALEHKFLLMVPQSMLVTWDIVIAGHGPDRERLDQALDKVASHFLLDPTHLAFAGHSDGGSYSLSTGLTNGRIVTHILAMSAGFMTVLAQEGAPKVFVAHARQDEQCPIDTAGRSHASKLRAAGYDLTYVEYDGPHASQPPVVAHAVRFFLGLEEPAEA